MDGYAVEGSECGPIDCNDEDASINPGATEICSDAIDNNCNGLVDTADMNAVDCQMECTDNDEDGYSIEGGDCGPMDCDDTNADVNPGALEICEDTVDNNCNGATDISDPVCQDNSDNGDKCEIRWWRCKDKYHHLNKWFDHICNRDGQDVSDGNDWENQWWDNAKSDEGVPDEDKSDIDEPGDVKPDEGEPDEGKSDAGESDEDESDEDESDEDESDEDESDEGVSDEAESDGDSEARSWFNFRW
jgi:hypothetical protein